jgi:hypothetical protein
MIMNSFLTRTALSSYDISIIGKGRAVKGARSQTTMYVWGEYFVSTSEPAAKSDIDYLVSPIEQIRDQINQFFGSTGSQTQVQCDDATWVVAPSARISDEYFDSYHPFFRTVQLYRARVGAEGDEESNVPTVSQMNAALLGLANLMVALAPAPSPMLLEDGTIGGYWRSGRCYVSIDFEVDGEHTWAGTDGVQFHSGTWQLPGNSMPQGLANELRALTA